MNEILKMFEQRLGKLLSPVEISAILYMVNDLKLSSEVISLILNYVLGKGIKNIRYIERIAIDWSDRGINTAEKAGNILNRLENKDKSNSGDYKKGNRVFRPENKFCNYEDTNKIDYAAYEEQVIKEMLGE